VYSEEFQEQIARLKTDKISGSEEIVRRAVLLIRNEIQLNPARFGKIVDLSEMLRKVIDIKKEMSALRNVLIYFMDFFQHGVAVEDLADRVIEKMDDQRNQLIDKLIPIISQCKNIVTMSRSSTIFCALKRLSETHDSGKLPDLTVFESRPALEGKKLAWEVVNLGYKVNYLVDAAVGRAIKALHPDLVLIGADTIFPNGNVVNKIGCHALAIFAFQDKVPFYVTSTTLKLLLKSIPFTIQSYPSTEVWAKDKPKEVKIYNPYFEIIPANLITGFITEYGFSTNIPDVRLVLEKEYIREMYE